MTERQRIRELTQQKLMDPYDDNEVKGTRIPEYSSVSRERDVYGELGWIGNFNVKCSKNNGHRHSTYKEFFDGPKNYHITFTNSTLTNSEFFRQNAPGNSVAYQRQVSSAGFGKSRPGSQSQQQLGVASMGGSHYSTPFILEQDKSNKHATHEGLKNTNEKSLNNMIPFLRDH